MLELNKRQLETPIGPRFTSSKDECLLLLLLLAPFCI